MCIHPCFPKGSRNKRDSQFSQSYREPFGISVVPVALLRLFFLLVTLVERRANVAALFRVVSSGVMQHNRFSDVFYSGFTHKILICLKKREIILKTKTCPILDTVKRTLGSRTAVFGRYPQKHNLQGGA